jgi:hypothetical protein
MYQNINKQASQCLKTDYQLKIADWPILMNAWVKP